MDLFQRMATDRKQRSAPLADRMRPRSLDAVFGQEHLLAGDAFFRSVVEGGSVPSMVLWGPPGVGKTTIARLVAEQSGMRFRQLSAVSSGVKDVRAVVREADDELCMDGPRTLLFIDEIHRFNKAQQDGLLPHVEDGTLTLLGATTENPSFEVIAPLLSRLRVFVLRALSEAAIAAILTRALDDQEHGLGRLPISVEPGAFELLAELAAGDGRVALNLFEHAVQLLQPAAPGSSPGPEDRSDDCLPLRLTAELVHRVAKRRLLSHDKSGERHFDLISALHKSIRASDPDASLYWLARMLEAGDDPTYVARRLVRVASEDVGLADPRALDQAVAASHAVRLVGMPECALALAQACVYLAVAPKSNALYRAYEAARSDVQSARPFAIPLYLRNAPTKLLKSLGYGEGYLYAHDQPDAIGTQRCLPQELARTRYYEPTDRGIEARIAERLQWIHERRAASRKSSSKAPSGPVAEEGCLGTEVDHAERSGNPAE
ncbi:replication-associated recombination protein A [Planctomycetota bacterium]